MQKIAITGASGFTGGYLSELLVEQGYHVHGLTHTVTEKPCRGVKYWACDLIDERSISDALDAIRPDRIVHLAAISFVAHGNIEDIYRTNVIGTRNLLEAALKSSLPIETILLASSANIYGNRAGGILSEDDKPAPANDYAVSKIAMEYVGRIYAGRLPIITTRPFNYTGVGQSLNFLIPKIVDHIRRRAPYIELGNLDIARDFSDVRAVTAAYAGLLRANAAIGGTYNICSGRAYSLREVLDMAQAISGHSIEIRVNPAFVRENEVKTLSGNRQRLEDLLPDLPNPPLLETLQWMLAA